jgi:hypothetical protein
MSFQAYIDNIYAKTGKTPEEFAELAKQKGLLGPDATATPVVNWLKEEHGLGHGHAMAIVQCFKNMGIWQK